MTPENRQDRGNITVRELAAAAVFTALIAVCSWISIPAAVPFTMQTFAIFLAVGVLGGRIGSLAVLVYLLMGAVGLPVFAGFEGGIGYMAGPTGGYIAGFLISALAMWLIEKLFGTGMITLGISMVIGLVVCYAFGTAWFIEVYSLRTGEIGLVTALGWCVIPYIVPDAIKIGLALVLTRKLRPMMIKQL